MSASITNSKEISIDLSEDEKNKLTFQLCQILENWKLEDADQLNILSLEDILKPRHLYMYRRGDKAFDFTSSASWHKCSGMIVLVGIFLHSYLIIPNIRLKIGMMR